MPAFYIAPEASIPYEFVGPSGARAVLNDPSDPDFVGYLDGEEALSGIDSPEVRDSYADWADRDGGISGTNHYSRRPIVMNGRVHPTSAADRNQKLGKLMAATDARSADGTLTWTPSGGQPVFLKYRRQLPFRAKGGFNKEFQLGLVANDPRIYSVSAFTALTETNSNSLTQIHRRFTAGGSAGVTIAGRTVHLPPGTYRYRIPVRCSEVGRTVSVASITETVVDPAPVVADGNWQVVEGSVVVTSGITTASLLTVRTNTALPNGATCDIGDPIIESPTGGFPTSNSTMFTVWGASSGFTMTTRTTNHPTVGLATHPGNVVSLPRVRVNGPLSNAVVVFGAAASVQLSPGSAYSSSNVIALDYGYRTAVKDGVSSVYGDVNPANSPWGGLSPEGAFTHPILQVYSDGGTDTRMETVWRGVWL